MSGMKRLNKILYLAVCVCISLPSFAQGDAKSKEILDAMSSKYEKLESFKAAITYSQPGSKPMKGDVTFKGKKFRLKLADQEIFTDGKVLASYMSDSKEVTLQEFDASVGGDLDPTQIYSAYKKGYKYAYLNQKKQGSNVYDVIELTSTNKTSPVDKVEIWVNQADKLIGSWTIKQKNGEKTSYKIDQFQSNVAVADTYFSFNPKQFPGVEVIDLR
jgi:outer membrane lipoprotein-sorting protein